MSQENESGVTPTSNESSAPPASIVPPPSVAAVPSRRPSLKAFAERAATMPSPARSSVTSIAPPSRQSVPPASTVTPRPSSPSRPSGPVSRPSEASDDDSGIINLGTVNSSATPAQIKAAEKAQPASQGLLDDAKPAAAAAPVAAVVTFASGVTEAKPALAEVKPIGLASAAKTPEKKGGKGMIAGGVIALLGLAAAFAMMQKNKAPEPAAATPQSTPAVVAEVKPAPTQAAPPPKAAEPVATAAAPEPEKVAAASPAGGGAAPSHAAAAPATNAAAATAAPKEANDGKVASAKPAPTATGKPGDLASEMAKAVGADGAGKKATQGTPEPAAGGTKSQNIPEQPSQGSVQAAVGSVMGGAKACVAGADDVSRAQITFSSAGSVSNVSVTGWAASNGASSCVKSALKGANVGPFSKSSFSVGVTIRP